MKRDKEYFALLNLLLGCAVGNGLVKEMLNSGGLRTG